MKPIRLCCYREVLNKCVRPAFCSEKIGKVSHLEGPNYSWGQANACRLSSGNIAKRVDRLARAFS